MTFSGKAIQKLGKRLRDGSQSSDDLKMLNEYRRTFDDLLINSSLEIGKILNQAELHFVSAGRSKRTKSIIRKLQRDNNYSMDLSRMSDIVGNRVILGSISDQQKAIDRLKESLSIKQIDDYRKLDGYRSVHLIVKNDSKLSEIQIRTLEQHLWAVESEKFGEQVKEKKFVTSFQKKANDYLNALSLACKRVENGEAIKSVEEEYSEAPFFENKKPLSFELSKLKPLFEKSEMDSLNINDSSFIIIYNNQTRQLVQKLTFSPTRRLEALDEYSRLTKSIPRNFETLILNASTDKVLPVTHPIFFG